MASAFRNVRILLLSGKPPNRIVKIISISEPPMTPKDIRIFVERPADIIVFHHIQCAVLM